MTILRSHHYDLTIIGGGVECGSNAVVSFSREDYTKFGLSFNDILDTFKFHRFPPLVFINLFSGLMEFVRSNLKILFFKPLQRLAPSLSISDFLPGNVGIRAQAVSSDRIIVKYPLFKEQKNTLHLINAPSPAATSCFFIAEMICQKYIQNPLPINTI